MTNGILIRRVGDAHPQGREETRLFEYKEGQPIGAFYAKAIDQLFSWATEKGVNLQELVNQTPALRDLVESSGGKVNSVR